MPARSCAAVRTAASSKKPLFSQANIWRTSSGSISPLGAKQRRTRTGSCSAMAANASVPPRAGSGRLRLAKEHQLLINGHRIRFDTGDKVSTLHRSDIAAIRVYRKGKVSDTSRSAAPTAAVSDWKAVVTWSA